MKVDGWTTVFFNPFDPFVKRNGSLMSELIQQQQKHLFLFVYKENYKERLTCSVAEGNCQHLLS